MLRRGHAVAQKGQEIGTTVKYSWQDLEGNHEYGLRTALCTIDSCSPADVFVSVNKLSVPFTDDYHDGIHYLAGGNPIEHIADFENLNSWNIAKPGHIFPGHVQHSVDVYDGVVYVQSRGVGTPVMPNSPMSPIYAAINNFVGLTAFGSMHNELKQKY